VSILSGSVGQGGANLSGDVRLVQHLLNDSIGRLGGVLLAVDGKAGPKTNAAILQYQRTNRLTADGRVDPAGATIKHMATAHLTALSAGIIPINIPRSPNTGRRSRRHSGHGPSSTAMAAMVKKVAGGEVTAARSR
jgi:peptidoglycan hydrolase-like protein with peptidoglycan-binding domain